jgi:hypothetical protein
MINLVTFNKYYVNKLIKICHSLSLCGKYDKLLMLNISFLIFYECSYLIGLHNGFSKINIIAHSKNRSY